MREPLYVFIFRLCFFVASVLVTVGLVGLSVNINTDNIDPTSITATVTNGLSSFANSLHTTMNNLRDSMQVADAKSDSPHPAALATVQSATSITSIVRPADDVPVPVIDSPPTPPAAHTPPAPAPAQPQVQASPTPISSTRTETTAPLPLLGMPNLYAWGNCTWWAAGRRLQVNKPIPNSWGNAATWASRAARDGYAVDHTPSPTAIMQTPNSAGGLGHVAFVESVDPDGTWHISEMNVLGLGMVDHKAEPPSAAAQYSFIHDKQ